VLDHAFPLTGGVDHHLLQARTIGVVSRPEVFIILEGTHDTDALDRLTEAQGTRNNYRHA